MASILSLPDLDRHLGADEIMELAERRIQRYATRDQLYEVYSRYYFGEQGGMGSPAVRAMNSQGRPLLRDLEVGAMGGGGTEYRSQRLAPVVDDAQALLGRMPNARVDPPDGSEAGVNKAEKQTKYLISTYDLSRMDEQQMEMGWYLPCLGDGMYLLSVEPELRRVVWEVVDPRIAYPAFGSGHRRFDVVDVIIRYLMDPYEARAAFGADAVARWRNGEVAITHYISQFQHTIVVGTKDEPTVKAFDARRDLPFCPALWVWNKKNGRMAQSDIAQSLVQQDALDFMTTVLLDGIVYLTYPVPVVREPTNLGTDGLPPVGPGGPPLTVGEKGGFEYVSMKGDLSPIQYGMQAMTQEIYSATGTSQVRQEGTIHSSIPTGRAMHAAQGPQATRVDLKQQAIGAALTRANEMTLEMQEKAPKLGDHTFDIFGRTKAGSFLEKFTPKTDIAGWYRNTVRWDQIIGLNQQQRMQMAYEGKAAGLMDSERAIELIGEEDPPGMVERVRREKEREMQMAAQMQQGAAPGGGGAPAGPGGGGPPPSPGGGGQQMPQDPNRIARPLGLGNQQSPLATGVPKGVSLEAVKKALELVADKLKGTVAVVGQLAQQGMAPHIEALISDFRDHPRVVPVLQALDPQAKVRAMDETKWPQDAVRVI